MGGTTGSSLPSAWFCRATPRGCVQRGVVKGQVHQLGPSKTGCKAKGDHSLLSPNRRRAPFRLPTALMVSPPTWLFRNSLPNPSESQEGQLKLLFPTAASPGLGQHRAHCCRKASVLLAHGLVAKINLPVFP